MTNTFTNRCLLKKLTVKSAKQRQFGSTATSWHKLKQAAGFLSLDLKCPHKKQGMQHKIGHCKMSEMEFEVLENGR